MHLPRWAKTFGAGVVYGVGGTVILLGVSSGFASLYFAGTRKIASMLGGGRGFLGLRSDSTTLAGGSAPSVGPGSTSDAVMTGLVTGGRAIAGTDLGQQVSDNLFTVGSGTGDQQAANDYYGATASSSVDDGSDLSSTI